MAAPVGWTCSKGGRNVCVSVQSGTNYGKCKDGKNINGFKMNEGAFFCTLFFYGGRYEL